MSGPLLAVDVFDKWGNLAETLDCIQGSTVTDDRTQANRRTCDLTVQDPQGVFSPANASSFLATGTTSGYVLKAFTRGNALGTFLCQTSQATDSGSDRHVEVTGVDSSWLATAFPIGATAWTIGAGTPWSWAIAEVIEFYIPQMNLSGFADVPWPTPAIVLNPGQEPWTEASTKWGPAIGYELWVDQNNSANLQAPPDPRFQVPAWYFQEGNGCHMTQVQHGFTDDQCSNVFRRDGVGPGNQVISAQYGDQNPASSTYIGTYGTRLNYQQDTLIASQPQADSAAQMQLFLGLGANEPVVLTLDPSVYETGVPLAGQMAFVTRAGVGLSNAYVVMDTIVHSFFPGDTTTVTGRRIAHWPGE